MGYVLSKPICLGAGLLYPAYASFKALESVQTEDDKQWLTYWVVYAFLTSAETATEKVFFWLPGYYAMKSALLLWMMFPKTKGALTIYKSFIQPFLKKHEKYIDKKIEETEEKGAQYMEQVNSKGSEVLSSTIDLIKKQAKP